MSTSPQPVLILYASTEGQTAKIAEYVGLHLRKRGIGTEVKRVEDAPGDLAPYGAIVLGGSIHAGKHQGSLKSFARHHEHDLAKHPIAFFSVSLSAVKSDEAHQAPIRKIVDEFLDGARLHPREVALFGGALRYSRYGVLKRRLLRWIASREGEATDTSRDWEYTDWAAVERFGNAIATMTSSASGPAASSPLHA